MASATALRPCIGRLTPRPCPSLTALPPSLLSTDAHRTRSPSSAFSTSSPHQRRDKPHSKTRDNNRFRGISPLRRSGLREPVSSSWDPLPKPADFKPQIKANPNHGLYGFFQGPDKLMNSPAEDMQCGRAWTAEELRKKGWEDLQKLWWVCCRERNRISTADRERERQKLGFGKQESGERDETVRKTMKAIRHVLTERYYLWEDAYKLAKEDPEIDLTRTEAPYVADSDAYEDAPEEILGATSGEGREAEPKLEREVKT